jgi:iron(III) transport system substrate-binding protein
VEVWRASSAKVLQRLVAEKKAERWDFDVASAGGPEMEALYREGLLQEIDSAAQRGLIEGTMPAHRGWAPQFINVFVQAYNTGLVRKDALPRTYQDLLDPRWKGKLGVEAHAAEWYCALAKNLGAQGRTLLDQIAARNGLSVREGNSVLTNVVVSGELPLALAVYSHLIDAAKERGAPVDWFVLAPAIARANGIGVSRRPPHPQAARLFYEYSLAEAQPLLVKLHYVSPVKKLSARFDGGKMLFVDLNADSAAVARCDAAYNAWIRTRTGGS